VIGKCPISEGDAEKGKSHVDNDCSEEVESPHGVVEQIAEGVYCRDEDHCQNNNSLWEPLGFGP